jgi:dolichyl-diphosphooligosaccharide--protein glycosyltransferase
MRGRKIKPAYYPLTLAGLGAAGLAIFSIIGVSLTTAFGNIFSWHIARETVLEMQSILFQGGSFSLSVAWANFTTGFFLSFISLGILIYLVIKRGSAEKNLFIVWSLVLLAATLGQRRFAYYFAVNVALLTGYLSVLIFFATRFVIAHLKGEPTNYLSWQILESPDVEKLITKPKAITPKMVKRKKARAKRSLKAGFQLTVSHITMALASIVIFLLVFLPNIGPAVATGKQARFAPDDAWCRSLSWLRENTPEPFGNPDFYYELYEPPPLGENYNYPESAYGVMAWWDYGHWITRIGRRLPNATPATWGICATLFNAQDEASANKLMDELGIRYVIIDHAIASIDEKFWAVPTLFGRSPEEFYDVYYQSEEGKLQPVWILYPEYYRTIVARLYNFDGEAVTPQSSTVVFYERISRDGRIYKVITDSKSFPSYEEAAAYVSSQTSDNCKLVGTNPFVSPVPLEKMEHYELIYSSDIYIMKEGVGPVPEIKIFEYVK